MPRDPVGRGSSVALLMFMSRLSELMGLEVCTEDLVFPVLASSSIEDCTLDSLTASSLWS